jgi:hypothetical protein
MDVHIGSIIKSRAKAIRLGPTELGMRIETSKQNVYGIFKRKSIDTELLVRISVALDHDFFLYLSKSLNGSVQRPSDAGKSPSKNAAALARENEYLRRINALQEEKISHLERQLEEAAE